MAEGSRQGSRSLVDRYSALVISVAAEATVLGIADSDFVRPPLVHN
ncbi:MAG TPA: hypothetical protein VME46_13160 [Acidimicrobiales bacterium]|nr:hypothetical protein [Acidimicrobiales bacterium]